MGFPLNKIEQIADEYLIKRVCVLSSAWLFAAP